MKHNSAPVYSTQSAPHSRLREAVERHCSTEWEKPVAGHTKIAFAALCERLGPMPAPLVLDSGCGTGASTRRLAQRFPHHWVLGVDQSVHRLSRSGAGEGVAVEDNCVLVRAELGDLWRLMSTARWRLVHHFLFYPNPWPKPGQLQRRWHAHPAWPHLLALGGHLELRTNWSIYAQEFALALGWGGHATVEPVPIEVDDPVSPFEHKYLGSGHRLWRVCAELGAGRAT